MSNLAVIGHNSARPAELTASIYAELRTFTTEHPVLQNEDEARAAAQLARRAKNTLDDLESDRKKKVAPLNEKVRETNAEYAEAAVPVQTALVLLKGRMTGWAKAEEERRQQEASLALLAATIAEEKARQAITDAAEAEANAGFGEAVDVVAAKQNAVAAFNDAKRANRDLQRAERDAEHVRMAPGLGAKAMSLRSHEELTVSDPAAAIAAIGLTEGIAAAIIIEARKYRKERKALPPGISSNITRSV